MEHVVRKTRSVRFNSIEVLALCEAIKTATEDGDNENHALRELFPILSRARAGATITLEPV